MRVALRLKNLGEAILATVESNTGRLTPASILRSPSLARDGT
jgi:hypothetical protein